MIITKTIEVEVCENCEAEHSSPYTKCSGCGKELCYLCRMTYSFRITRTTPTRRHSNRDSGSWTQRDTPAVYLHYCEECDKSHLQGTLDALGLSDIRKQLDEPNASKY